MGHGLDARQPHGHLAAAAIGPRVVRNHGELLLVLHHLALRVVGQRDGFAVDHLDAVQQVGPVFGGQSCVGRQQQVAHLAVGVVDPLGGVNDGPALDGHAAAVGGHVIVGQHPPDRHGQVSSMVSPFFQVRVRST